MNTRSALLTILNVVSVFIGVVLGGRILFLLFGANPATPIVNWINTISEIFIYPFRGLFQSIILTSNSAIDVTAIVALVVYTIVFTFIYRTVFYFTRNTDPVVTEMHHAHI